MNKPPESTKEFTGSTKAADEIDRMVGEKITIMRTMVGKSRQSLADQIGITHQQLHKYEKAINRIPVSRLFAISRALNIDITNFFDEMNENFLAIDSENQRAYMEVMRDFINIKEAGHRNAVKSLIRSLTTQ